MPTRYGVQMSNGLWWAMSNRFADSPLAAQWFASALSAELAAIRELPDKSGDYTVQPIPVALPRVN